MKVMVIKKSVITLIITTFFVVSGQPLYSQESESLSKQVQQKAVEAISEAKQGDKSFAEALDSAGQSASSLLSEVEEAPYLFEYEYEYEYSSGFTHSFKKHTSNGATAGDASQSEATDQQDRIEEAQQRLAQAERFAPKSRVREQFIQLGGESLSVLGLQGLGDLTATGVRGLMIQPNEFSGSSLDLSLRGIGGTTVDQVTGESGVGVFLDGVPVLRGQSFSLGLLDLESVDLLRGSRGVASGRNAVGGAVYMQSAKPSGEFGFKQRIRLGLAQDDVQALTNINLPQVANLPMTRVSYLSSQQAGRIQNDEGDNANDFGEKANTAWRIALTALPSDNMSIDAAIERSDFESTSQYYQAINADGSTLFGGVSLEPNYQASTRATLMNPLSDTKQITKTVTLSYAPTDRFEIKPIVGHSELDDTSFVQFDDRMGPSNQGVNSLESFANEVTYSEIQFNGRLFNQLVNYSAGYTATSDKSDYNGTVAVGKADLDSESLYLQTMWRLSSRLNLTAGVRETRDKKDFTRSSFRELTSDTPVTDVFTTFLDQTYTDYLVATDVDISKTLKTYISYSTAHKAGGSSLFGQTINTGDGPRMPIYDTEKATTIQAGVKGSAMQNAFYYDAALFSTEIDDRQIVYRDPNNRRITDILNASKSVTVNGLELDLRYSFSESLRFGAFLSLLDAEESDAPAVYVNTTGSVYRFPLNGDLSTATIGGGKAFITQAPERSTMNLPRLPIRGS